MPGLTLPTVGIPTVALQSDGTAARGIGRYVGGLIAALEARDDLQVVRVAHESRRPPGLDAWLDPAPLLADRPPPSRPAIGIIYDAISFVPPYQWLGPSGAMANLERHRGYDRLLSISRWTRDAFVGTLGFPPDRIAVIGAGIDLGYWSPSPPSPSSPPDNGDSGVALPAWVQAPFLLNVGGSDRRKGAPELIDAFARIPVRLREGRQLVFAYHLKFGHREILTAVARHHGVDEQVIATGYVSDRVLRALYRQADLMAFPSKSEGFGLPIIEAMACGCPVVCGDNTSQPEVAGDAAILVDVEDPESLASGMISILEDPGRRSAMVVAGLDVARRHDWATVAGRVSGEIHATTARCRAHRVPGRSGRSSRRIRVAFASPWPPTLSGCADYSDRLVPALDAAGVEVDRIGPGDRFDPGSADVILYSMGNNPIHHWVYDLAVDHPGVVTLHDLAIRGLFLDDPTGALDRLCDRSLALVVHSPCNMAALGRHGAKASVIPFGAEIAIPSAAGRRDVRTCQGLEQDKFLAIVGGIVHPSKLTLEVLVAWNDLHVRNRLPIGATLAFLGPEWDGGMTRRLADSLACRGSIRFLGLKSPGEFAAISAAADLGIVLRRPPTNGETSAALFDFLRAGVACLVTNAGTFADLPDSVVCKVDHSDTFVGPYAAGTDGLVAVLARLVDDADYRSSFAVAGLDHVRRHHTWEASARSYLSILETAATTLGWSRKDRDSNLAPT